MNINNASEVSAASDIEPVNQLGIVGESVGAVLVSATTSVELQPHDPEDPDGPDTWFAKYNLV